MPPAEYLRRRPPFRLALVGVSRIQALTLGGEVLLSDTLAARVSSMASVGPARLERMKGLTEPAVLHRLLDVRLAAEAGDALAPAAEAARP